MSQTDLKRYESELAAAYKGEYSKFTGTPFKPPEGKDVWVISFGESTEASQLSVAAMKEAASKLHWELHVYDGKFELSRYQTRVEQAIAAGTEGIVLLYIDCAPVKAALENAKAAGVLVAGVESEDCSPSLESPVKACGNKRWAEWAERWGEYQAIWVIAETHGEAKTITTEQTDLESPVNSAKGFDKKLEECPTCEVVDQVEFVGSELGPELQQKIEQAPNQHPEANSFIASYGSALTNGGGAAALRASGRLGEIAVLGGEGNTQEIEMIRAENGSDACAGFPNAWIGVASLNILALGFAGQNMDSGDSGIGWQDCDKEHNLPPEGSPFQPPLDFMAAYEELWSLR